jgi:hypothetical protein
VSPGPACQPVLPPDTVVTAHRSAPFPHPCSAGCAAWPRHAARARRSWAAVGWAPSAGRPGPPLSLPLSLDPCPSCGATPLDLAALVGDHRSYPIVVGRRRLAVDAPFWCAHAPSSLSGVLPLAPARPPAVPCHRLAAIGPLTSAPSHPPVRGLRAVPTPRARPPRAPRHSAACRFPRWTGPPG